MKHPCLECSLRYSSYCMGCEYKLFGIGELPILNENRQCNRKDANEKGQTFIFASDNEYFGSK